MRKLNEIKEVYKSIFKNAALKNILQAFFLTVFIVIPIILTGIFMVIKSLNLDHKLSSIFSLNSFLVIAPLFSLIISNYKRDNEGFWEEKIKEISMIIFLSVISSTLALSFISILIGLWLWNEGIDVLLYIIIHGGIFIFCFYHILDIDKLIKYFIEFPYKLYSVLWTILLVVFIIYDIIFKFILN